MVAANQNCPAEPAAVMVHQVHSSTVCYMGIAFYSASFFLDKKKETHPQLLLIVDVAYNTTFSDSFNVPKTAECDRRMREDVVLLLQVKRSKGKTALAEPRLHPTAGEYNTYLGTDTQTVRGWSHYFGFRPGAQRPDLHPQSRAGAGSFVQVQYIRFGGRPIVH